MPEFSKRIKARAKKLLKGKPSVPVGDAAHSDSGAHQSSAPTKDENASLVAPVSRPTEPQSTKNHDQGVEEVTTLASAAVETHDETALASAAQLPSNTQAFEAGSHTSPVQAEFNLWEKAIDKLTEEEQRIVLAAGESTKTSERTTASIISDLIAEARARQEDCEKKAWRVKFGADEVILRDQATLIISWLTKAGDIGLQFAPSVVQHVWPCVKTILKAPVMEAEQTTALLSVAEKVCRVSVRGGVYERCYLEASNLSADIAEAVREDLVALYKACLELLAKTNTLLAKNQLKRTAYAILHPDAVKQEAGSGISELEGRLSQSIQAASAAINKKLLDQVQNLEAPMTRVDERVSTILEAVDMDQNLRILEWISPVKYSSHHDSIVEERMSGSCEWLLRHPKFQEWQASSGCALLWLQGLSGSGKTFLTSKVIDHRRQLLLNSGPNDEALAFFYFNRTDKERNSDLDCLRSLVRQLSTSARSSGQMQPSLKTLYNSLQRDGRDLNRDLCNKQLVESMNLFPRTTIVLDALDECDKSGRQKLIKILVELMEISNCPLQVFISSRPDGDIKKAFHDRVSLEVGVADNQDDIAKYIDDKIKGVENDCWEDIPEELKDEVVSTLKEKSQGMFLWSALQVSELLKLPPYEDDIRDRLGKLPSDLKKTYDEICSRQAGAKFARQVLNRAIMWVMAANEPPKSAQLLVAVRIDPVKYGETEIEPPSHPSSLTRDSTAPKGTSYIAAQVTEAQLLEFCANLLTLDPSTGWWSFSHASVVEYFEEHHFSMLQAHAFVGSVSLVMIMDVSRSVIVHKLLGAAKCLEGRIEESPWKLYAQIKDASNYKSTVCWHTFVRYICDNWGEHVSIVDKSLDHLDRPSTCQKYQVPLVALSGLSALLRRFLGHPNDSSPAYRLWLAIFVTSHLKRRQIYPVDINDIMRGSEEHAFLAMVRFGLFHLLRSWWQKSATSGGGEQVMATEANDDSTVFVDTTVRLGEGWTLLHMASLSGHPTTVKALLERGMDANGQDVYNGMTALSLACAEGHVEVCGILISSAGCSPNLPPGLGNPLYIAAENGQTDVIRYLLSAGADPNRLIEKPRFFEYIPGSVLAVAAVEDNVDTLRVLIAEGKADPDMLLPDWCRWGTAAIAAAHSLNWNALEYLIRVAHVDPNAYIQHPSALKTVAIAVIANGYCNYLGLSRLIELGVDFASFRDIGGLKYLSQSAHRDGALENTVIRRDLDATKFLVEECGIDVNHLVSRWHPEYGCALSAALQLEITDLPILEYLVEKGADVNLQTPKGFAHSPLATAAVLGKFDSMQVLIEHGAAVNLQLLYGDHGSVLAMVAATSFSSDVSREEVLRFLLDHDAEINLALHYGKFRCALFAAIWHGHEDIVAILLDRGADVNFHTDHDHHTDASDIAVVQGEMTAPTARLSLDLELETGSDLALEKAGSALMVAAWAGHEDLVRLLIERGADLGRPENYGWETVLAKWKAQSGKAPRNLED